MIRGGAVTSLAIARANAVAVLRDLECGPVMCGHRRDQPSDNTGLAHAARMPTNHNDRHICTCGTGTLARALTRGSRCQECPRHTILYSLTLPTPPIVSNTPVSGAPASPRTQLPCRERFSSRGCRFVLPESHLLRCAHGRRCLPDHRLQHYFSPRRCLRARFAPR